MCEFDSKVGLNGQQSLWSFPCILDEEKMNFFVWLGDVTLDKFTKSTFLNLVSFAEKEGAVKMILVQNRDHVQKDQFKKLFSVLDAIRVDKKGMTKLMPGGKAKRYMQKHALYEIELC
jgi:hypothetical protein